MILRGKTISPGVVRGVTHLVDAQTLLASALDVPPSGTAQAEVERLKAAIGRAGVQLERVRRQLLGRVPSQDLGIFSAHSGLLRDAKFVEQIEAEIYQNGQSAEAAIARVIKQLYVAFRASTVSLAQDRAADILDIGRRLLECLSLSPYADTEFEVDAIVVAPSLTPSEVVRFAHQGVIGFITESCGARSHTAILARGLALPLIAQVKPGVAHIPNRAEVYLDATGGLVVVAPTAEEQITAREIVERIPAPVVGDLALIPSAPITQDQEPIKLLLNISDPAEAASVSSLGAAGIGLFRTEFLYMDRLAWPAEDENFEIYQQTAAQIGDAELNIRLVDFGAEKCPAYSDIPLNRNPSLGLRGIRLLLQREDILRPQVRALARLGRERPLTVLLPMLDTLDSLEAITDKLCRLCGCGRRADLPFRMETMIEVPSAAFMIEEILEGVDGLSIGLNDLTQYLLAADRDDESVEMFHDPMQPAVLRIVRRMVQAADACGKPVTICGELAGDPQLTGLLLGLGVRRLSVARSNYPHVASAIQYLSMSASRKLADQVLQLSTGAAVRHFVAEHFGSYTTGPEFVG